MIKGVTFVSRQIAEDMMPVPDVGMISISDPGSRLVALQDGWGSVIRLRFHDLSRQWQNYVLMSATQARMLLFWLKQHEEELSGIVVHCEQGISRSAAVAKFLRERYELPVDEPDVRFYNKHVYKLLSDLDGARR